MRHEEKGSLDLEKIIIECWLPILCYSSFCRDCHLCYFYGNSNQISLNDYFLSQNQCFGACFGALSFAFGFPFFLEGIQLRTRRSFEFQAHVVWRYFDFLPWLLFDLRNEELFHSSSESRHRTAILGLRGRLCNHICFVFMLCRTSDLWSTSIVDKNHVTSLLNCHWQFRS